MGKLLDLTLILTALLIVFTKPSFAYLDPGSGSYIFQMLLAGGLGALFVFKNSLRTVADKLRSLLPKEKSARPNAKD